MTKKELKFEIKDASGGAAFTVRIVTRTSRSEVSGIQEDGIIKVRLKGSPDDGSANEELLDLLAKVLEVERGKIEIVAGLNARDKLISVEGITTDYLEEKILSVAGSSDDVS